ncbi:MAG: serine O-acetyltransferase [Phycisphaerales bacterium]
MSLDKVKADTHRIYGEFRWRHVALGFIRNRTFRLIVTLRACQAVARGRGPLRLLSILVRLSHRLATSSAAVDLPWSTKIGGGLAIVHGWGLVINPSSVIGRNVTMFHGVTLGQRDRIKPDGSRSSEFPVIEDEVWIGPHAVIVGGVVIGKGSKIAAGSFVTQSVPPYSVVVGNPASVVKSNCIPDVGNRAPIE